MSRAPDWEMGFHGPDARLESTDLQGCSVYPETLLKHRGQLQLARVSDYLPDRLLVLVCSSGRTSTTYSSFHQLLEWGSEGEVLGE